ncbi:MAG: hypothetical protein ACI4NE_07005 [Succinivibrio sp.]
MRQIEIVNATKKDVERLKSGANIEKTVYELICRNSVENGVIALEKMLDVKANDLMAITQVNKPKMPICYDLAEKMILGRTDKAIQLKIALEKKV